MPAQHWHELQRCQLLLVWVVLMLHLQQLWQHGQATHVLSGFNNVSSTKPFNHEAVAVGSCFAPAQR